LILSHIFLKIRKAAGLLLPVKPIPHVSVFEIGFFKTEEMGNALSSDHFFAFCHPEHFWPDRITQ
jgi:hypothetical protein